MSWFDSWPVRSVIAFILAPHLAGSVVNISYNSWIVREYLSASQAVTFNWLVIAYNLIFYPVCIFAVVRLVVLPILRYKQALEDPKVAAGLDIDDARRKALRWPLWAALLACVGWFPGVVFFPLVLHIFNPPVSFPPVAHFFMSITLSGLIALTYSVVGLQLVSLRYYYTQLWDRGENMHETARTELRDSRRLIRISQFLAFFIPLLGACLFVVVKHRGLDDAAYRVFQFLTLWLIVLGMGGFQLAMTLGQSLTKTIDAMTGRAAEET